MYPGNRGVQFSYSTCVHSVFTLSLTMLHSNEAVQRRSLATLGLPSGLVAALSKAGYETVGDLADTSEGELQEGPDALASKSIITQASSSHLELGLSESLPFKLLIHLPGSSSHAHRAPPPTQPISASHILTQSTQLKAGLQPLGHASQSLGPRPRSYSTPSSALNTLLSSGTLPLKLNGVEVSSPVSEGGLRPMYVLEVSGPPGSGKGCIALELIRSAVGRGEEVLVIGVSTW